MTVRDETAKTPSETARGAVREGGILETVRRPTERRARLPGRSTSRVQAGRSCVSAVAVEAIMNNVG
jgi:hypothetical protein